MNKARREKIEEIMEGLRKLSEQIEDVRSQIEEVRDEEQEYYDNMPEPFQNGDKGAAAEAAVSLFDDAIAALEDFDFDSVFSALEGAAE